MPRSRARTTRASPYPALAGLTLLLALALALQAPDHPAAPRHGARHDIGRHDIGLAPRRAERADLARLAAACEHRTWSIRWDAVDELGRRRDRRAVPLLLRRVLHDDNPHPRWRALWALRRVDPTGAAAIPALASRLERGGAEAPVAERTAARNAAVALAFFGRSEGRAELVAALEDRDSFRRWEAAYSLGSIGDRQVAAALDQALARRTEPDPRVRGQIVLSLARAAGRGAVPRLLEALTTDESPEVRRRAAMALPTFPAGGPVSRAVEGALAAESDPRVREQIESALHGAGRHPSRKEETDEAES